jgi:hypothetical protein
VALGAAHGGDQLAGGARAGPRGSEAAALVERLQRGIGTDELAGDRDRTVLAELCDAAAQLLFEVRPRGRRRDGGRESERGERCGEDAAAAYQRLTRPVSTWMKSERW